MKTMKAIIVAAAALALAVVACRPPFVPDDGPATGSYTVAVTVGGTPAAARGIGGDPLVKSVELYVTDSEGSNALDGQLESATLTYDEGSGAWRGNVSVRMTGLLRFEAVALADGGFTRLYEGWAEVNISGTGDSVSIAVHSVVDLVGEWLFDGSYDDTSGGGHSGTATTGVSFAADRFGNAGGAVAFDGTNTVSAAYVSMTGLTVDTAGAACNSVSIWVRRLPDTANSSMFVDWGGSHYNLWLCNNAVGFNTNAGDTTGAPDLLAPNTWHHVVGVFYNGVPNASTVKLFIDGVEQTLTVTNTPLSEYVTSTLILSGWEYDMGSGNYGRFMGSLDDVRVYDRVLTGDEVAELYHEGGWDQGLTGLGSVEAEWGFSGNAADSSVNIRHGTAGGGVVLTADRFGYTEAAYSFDGVDDYITIPDFIGGWRAGSVALWFKPQGDNVGVDLFTVSTAAPGMSGGENLSLCMGGDPGCLGAVISPQWAVSTVNPGTDQWCFAVMTWEPGSLKLYLDGAAEPIATYALSVPVATGNLVAIIGAGSQTVNYFHGAIDDVRVWDRALSAAEAAELYAEGGWTGNPAGSGTLAAEWLFGGNGADTSGYSRHAVPRNGAALAPDRFGNADAAYRLDGVDDYIDCGAFDSTSGGAFTLSAWARLDTTAGPLAYSNCVIAQDDTASNRVFQLSHYNGGFTWFRAVEGNIQGTRIAGVNSWYHVAVVVDGTSHTMYLDGVQVAGPVTSTLGSSSTTPLFIGRLGNGSLSFDGCVDDVRLYEAALSSTEIEALYHAGGWDTTGTTGPGGAEGEWTFTGNLADSSGNANDGAAAGGAVATADRFGTAEAAYSFDGIDDYLSFATTACGANSFAMSMWVKPTATHEVDGESQSGIAGTSGQRYAFTPTVATSPATGCGISVGTNGVSVYEHSGSYMPPLLVWTGDVSTWTHVVVVYNNKTPSLYINGAFVRTGLTSTMTAVYNPLNWLGGMYTSSYYQGAIDDVRVYEEPLTADEVAALYHEGDWDTTPMSPGATTGEWLFSGDANDSSGYGRDGTIYGGVTSAPDRFEAAGEAYAFDGSTGYIEVGSLVRKDQGSISVWFKSDVATGVRNVIDWGLSNESDLKLWTQEDAAYGGAGYMRMRCNYYDGSSFTNADQPCTLLDGTWMHTVVSWDPTGGSKMYRNGRLVATAEYRQPDHADVGSFGRDLFGDTNYFDGVIDDIRVYDRPLSESEVLALYQEGDWALAPAVPSGMVGQWLLAGNANDTVGTYHGTVNGDATATTDRFGATGAALSFDGDGDYVSIPTIGIATDISVSAWAYTPTTPSSNLFIVQKAPSDQNWQMYYGGDGYLHAGGPLGSLTCALPVGGIWHHLVMTQTGTTAALYVDGTVRASGTVTAIGNGSGAIEIGRSDVSGYWFNGAIDDVRIWNKALTAQEVRDLFNEAGY